MYFWCIRCTYIYAYNIVKAECVEPAAAFYLRLMRAIMNNLMLIRVIKYITECAYDCISDYIIMIAHQELVSRRLKAVTIIHRLGHDKSIKLIIFYSSLFSWSSKLIQY